MRYVDASALAKLVLDELESPALLEYLRDARYRPLASSVIARTEVAIAIARTGRDVRQVLADDSVVLHVVDVPVLLADVTSGIARLAAAMGADLGLRTLDAIHVATAASLHPGLEEVVTYDRRMINACAALGIQTVAPGVHS